MWRNGLAAWEWFLSAVSVDFKKRWIGVKIPIAWTGYEKPVEPKLQDCLTLERMFFTDKSTIGELRLDGELVCYTLEDTCRANGIKIYGKTAIPAGRYEVVVTYSERFKRPMPLLLSVPDYEGVRIHTGNTSDQTQGCILIGMRKDVDVIYDSRKAFDLLFPEIVKRTAADKLWISIIGGRSA